MTLKIDEYLRELVKRDGSDLHLRAGRPPLMRIRGEMMPSEFPVTSGKEVEELLMPMLSDIQRKKLAENLEIDFSYNIEGLARFRGSIFYQMGSLGGVFRVNPIDIKSIDELGLPEVLKELISRKQGLILVTGPTGSGKSTTLAAMIDHLNKRINKHIITIEDPIEFVYNDDKCTITQREIGSDTHSFSEALKRAMRQDPDIILIGEMRDVETMQTALSASETGHLVFSTLHTNYAKQSITRIIDAFPPELHHQIRIRLALSLIATVSQRLVTKSDDSGRVAVMEIMINTPTIKKSLIDAKLDNIDKIIAESATVFKSQTMNQHLFQLVQQGVFTMEDAIDASLNPSDLRIMFQTQMAYKKEEEKKPSFPKTPPWIKDK